jgi:hypothetical protein
MGTASIEILRRPGAGKRIQVLYELGGERVKAGLAILGPRGLKSQPLACLIQMRQRERAEFVGP